MLLFKVTSYGSLIKEYSIDKSAEIIVFSCFQIYNNKFIISEKAYYNKIIHYIKINDKI